MNVDIDLPLLKLKGVKYIDKEFKYDGYRLTTFDANLEKLGNHFEVAQEFFFQDEMVINKGVLDEVGLDVEKTTYELANILFGNLETAANVQKHTGVRFDQIKPEFEGHGDGNRYSVDGQEYDVYYENELMATAKEYHSDYARDQGISDMIGDIKYINDYYDVIDADKLWELIEEYAEDEGLDLSEAPDDVKKAIQWFADEMGDDGDFIFELIDEKELFDYDAYTDSSIGDVDYAVDVMNPYVGDLEYTGSVSLDGWKESIVYIFERY